jgi:SpoVK/Ycf46/Vps4 family AAA+-type ATPase
LREKGEIIFIVATNYIKDFDPAVKRPGRFDYVIPVGPPTASERREILCIKLESHGITTDRERKKLAILISGEIGKIKIPVLWDDGATDMQKPKDAQGDMEKSGKNLTVKWTPTIGELGSLAEQLAIIYLKRRDEIHFMDDLKKVLNSASSKPLINGKQLKLFKKEVENYRWPREV